MGEDPTGESGGVGTLTAGTGSTAGAAARGAGATTRGRKTRTVAFGACF